MTGLGIVSLTKLSLPAYELVKAHLATLLAPFSMFQWTYIHGQVGLVLPQPKFKSV